MENNIFDYSNILRLLRNKDYMWEDILEEYEKVQKLSDFQVTYISGLFDNEDNKVIFYHIFDKCIVEWTYCFESKKIINEIYRVTNLADIILEIKKNNDIELRFNIKGREISLNNFNTNGSITLKLKENIVKFYKELLK